MMFALILLIFTFGSISAPPFSQEIKNCDSSGPRVSGLSLDSALTTFLCYTDKDYEAMGELEKKQKLAQKIAPMLRYENSYGDLVKELVFMKSDTLVKLVNVIMNTENAQIDPKSIEEYIATIHRLILKPNQDSELVNPHLVSLIKSNVGEPGGRKGRGAFWNKLLSMIGLNKDLSVKVPASDKSDSLGKASTAGEGSTASPASSSVATSTDVSTVALTTASPTSAATTATTMATVTTLVATSTAVTTLTASTVTTIAATTTTMTTTATTMATTTATTMATTTATTVATTTATTMATTTATTMATTTATTVATTTATTMAATTATTVAATTATTVATTTATTVAATTATTTATVTTKVATSATTTATTTATTVAATTASTAASTTTTASTTVTTIAATTASTAVTSTVAITTTATAAATTTASCLLYSPQVEATIDGAIGSQRSFDSATVEVSTSDKPTVTSEGECCSACQAKAADTNLYNFNPNQNICFCKKSICGTSPKTKFSQVQSAGACPKI